MKMFSGILCEINDNNNKAPDSRERKKYIWRKIGKTISIDCFRMRMSMANLQTPKMHHFTAHFDHSNAQCSMFNAQCSMLNV